MCAHSGAISPRSLTDVLDSENSVTFKHKSVSPAGEKRVSESYAKPVKTGGVRNGNRFGAPIRVLGSAEIYVAKHSIAEKTTSPVIK